METELGSAAKRHAKGCGHYRDFGVFDRHGRLLEGLDHHGDVIIGAFGQGHGHHHEIGADREVDALVGDDQAHAFLFRPLDRLMGHGQDVAADGVHLGMELEAEDAVAKVNDRAVGILLHHLAGLLEDLETNLTRLDRHRNVGFTQQIVVFFFALLVEAVEGLYALQGLGHLDAVFFRPFNEILYADGIEHLERTDLPVEAPAHGVVDIDDVIGDFWDAVHGIDEGVADGLPGELGALVAGANYHLDLLAGIVDLLDGLG
ncbi:MAG: hypothetical protein ACD_75C02258G0002 [uncultured bacterium]|nr:MAG: hypothetical protein ACD_75C02258G0002 [uncultured bacterium]